METPKRLTQYAHGGGCACKIPPGELEQAVAGLRNQFATGTSAAATPDTPGTPTGPAAEVLVGLDDGDDAAVVLLSPDKAVVSTADFFTPVVDDPVDWGRIAAANALSDIYAMGGTPVMAINLVGWPREVLPPELLTEVLRGGLEVATRAACPVIGGHSIDNPEPIYGMAATGTVHPDRLLRNDAAAAGLPISLTKPLGLGVLNNHHKSTGTLHPEAVAVMTTLNDVASRAAVDAGARAATDVTGFGLLGHLFKMCRASGVAARIDAAAVPYVPGAREALAAGHVPGGSRRNLDWVAPHLAAEGIAEEELILLADAQTSGGLLVVGEVPGAPIVGETVAAGSLPEGALVQVV
ncbi:selenophosphate synthase [Kytococcus aerolatus]|uniref:Selenide, water dikinase n=1 Tax=Kytococcus aerolatus TaxID=592308 RepID=A0A212U5J6_9MICO|nr:selenide, water dikinase SelD [Kytococcus aerolatus]SNC73532.1 selenophosphate synthase [Kytococcus aerolatus]